MALLPGSLRQVSLSVADVDASVVFYRDVLEVPVIARFGDLAFLDLGGVRLALSRSDADPPANSVLYFAVADLHGTRAALESRGVEFVDEPHVIFADADGVFGEPGRSEWMTFFHDPEGNLLALSARLPT